MEDDVAVRFKALLAPEWSLSDSSDSNEEDFGDVLPGATETLSYGLRVLNIGLPLSPLLPFSVFAGTASGICSFTFFGKVKAQFSHGIALFLSFSS
jgi:hypothetical protein